MRFLVDASLSPSVVGSLNDTGHDAVHVGDVLPLNATDAAVFDAAVEQQRVIVTADTDFGEILARRQATIFGDAVPYPGRPAIGSRAAAPGSPARRR